MRVRLSVDYLHKTEPVDLGTVANSPMAPMEDLHKPQALETDLQLVFIARRKDILLTCVGRNNMIHSDTQKTRLRHAL